MEYDANADRFSQLMREVVEMSLKNSREQMDIDITFTMEDGFTMDSVARFDNKAGHLLSRKSTTKNIVMNGVMVFTSGARKMQGDMVITLDMDTELTCKKKK